MGRSCGGGKTDGVHQLRPLFLLLLARSFSFLAGTARSALATEAAAIAIAATETATFALAAEAAAAIVTLAVAIGLAHHGGGAFLELLDANAQVAEHVFADPLLALDLGDGRGRRIDVEQHEMRLAILVDAIGER